MIGYNGLDNLMWFLGYVAVSEDPARLARIKVRVFGVHPTVAENTVPDEDLPWAYVMRPNSVMFGEFKVGDMVFGCFLDGKDAQQPLVLGMIGTNKVGAPTMAPRSPETGFNPEAPATPQGTPGEDGRTFGTGECYVTSVAPAALSDSLTPEYRGLLATIASYEQGSGGYSGYFKNSLTLDLNAGHPNIKIPIGGTGPNANLKSSAGGRYQFLGSTWIGINGGKNVPMTPENQDRAAIALAEQLARKAGISNLQSYLEQNGMDEKMIGDVLGDMGGWEAFRVKKPECFKSIYNQFATPASQSSTTGPQ